jgi:hypothetical protein
MGRSSFEILFFFLLALNVLAIIAASIKWRDRGSIFHLLGKPMGKVAPLQKETIADFQQIPRMEK